METAMFRIILVISSVIMLFSVGCNSSDDTNPSDNDGDIESEASDGDDDAASGDGDMDADDLSEIDTEATVDGDEDNDNQTENDADAAWDYRSEWIPPQEDWSDCPEKDYLSGLTLKEKAAYYDWIVPKLHQVPADEPEHAEYSRVFKIECDGPIPSSIVPDEQLPFCKHSLSENNGLWTSLYVASQAFRYAATGDEEALEQLRRTLNGTYQMLKITGKPGLFTRDFRDPRLPQQYCIEDEEPWASAATDNEHYARYIPPAEDMVGNQFIKIDEDGCFMTWDPALNDGAGGWAKDTEHCTDTRFAGFCWQMNVSKDEYSGHMFAAGIVAKLIDDPQIHDMAVDILGQVGHHLVDNNFWINDYDGRNTRYGSAHAMALDEMPGSNAIMALAWIKEAAVATGDPELIAVYNDCLLQLSGELECIDQPFETPRDYREYLNNMGLALGCNSNYDTISIAELNYFNLIWFEEDADLRTAYRDAFRGETQGPDNDGRDLWAESDPFRNMMLVSMMGSEGYDQKK